MSKNSKNSKEGKPSRERMKEYFMACDLVPGRIDISFNEENRLRIAILNLIENSEGEKDE